MPSPFVSSVRSCKRLLLLLAAVLIAGLTVQAEAQTAPQLLPSSVKVVAGGGTAAIAANASCPVSGFTSTDAYGDGCLATEVQLAGPRYAVTDKNGNIFFSDYTNNLIRRVDATTGIITAVAGGVAYTASPGSGATCGTRTSSDAKGDGCFATAVYLAVPTGLTFDSTGNLYFSEIGASTPSAQEKIFGADVRKITAGSDGLIPTSDTGTAAGTISLVDGALSSYYYYGYTANNASGNIIAATQSYMDSPYGLSIDNNGNLYIAEEGKAAVLVVNTSSNTNTVTGVSIPSGTVAKIAGYYSSVYGAYCPNGDTSPDGCAAGTFTGTPSANSAEIHYPYATAFDSNGNVYVANEYNYDVVEINTAGTISNFSGEQTHSSGTLTTPVTTRGAAGSFYTGSPHGVAADTYAASNIYVTDSVNGIVWRVDGAGNYEYPVAGGAASVCSAATDTYGDGCPALQAKFGASTTGSSGLFGISVDQYADLFLGDTVTNLVREVASGTQFGPIGANQPTQNVIIHFAAGDSPAATTPYAITAGATNFSLGTATCVTNSDTTKDCTLPITATPPTTGPFSGTLTVTATNGGAANFPLSGNFVNSPLTRTVVTTSSAANCANNSEYSTTTPVTLTATVYSSGSPTGTVTFYANGTAINATGNPAMVTNGVATLQYTFATANTYTIYAVYSGGGTFTGSTSKNDTVTIATPSLGASVLSYQSSAVVPGQTALYSFNLLQTVYTGTYTFACTGLPTGAACNFNTNSVSANGCYLTNTYTLSISTTAPSSAILASTFPGGRNLWSMLSLMGGISMALLIGMRRKALRFRQLWLVMALLLTTFGASSCGSGAPSIQGTPAGSYPITVTVTGTNNVTTTFGVTLTVN